VGRTAVFRTTVVVVDCTAAAAARNGEFSGFKGLDTCGCVAERFCDDERVLALDSSMLFDETSLLLSEMKW
jgi:hypothetical protein